MPLSRKLSSIERRSAPESSRTEPDGWIRQRINTKRSCLHLMLHVTCRFSIKLKSKIARYWNCCPRHDVVSVCDFVSWIQSSQRWKAVTATLSLSHLNSMNIARFAFKGHFPYTLYKAVRDDTLQWENKRLVVSQQACQEMKEIAKTLGLTCHDSPHSHPSSPDEASVTVMPVLCSSGSLISSLAIVWAVTSHDILH